MLTSGRAEDENEDTDKERLQSCRRITLLLYMRVTMRIKIRPQMRMRPLSLLVSHPIPPNVALKYHINEPPNPVQ